LSAASAVRVFHFANVRQKRGHFAKHWQNGLRARPMDLPNIGKIKGNLPSIGELA